MIQLQQGSQQSPQGVLELAGPVGLSWRETRGQAFAPFRSLSLHWGCPSEAILGEGCTVSQPATDNCPGH